jgi:hypothetical protein
MTGPRPLATPQAIQGWKSLGSIMRDLWRNAAIGTGLSGYHLYMHAHHTQKVQHPNHPHRP